METIEDVLTPHRRNKQRNQNEASPLRESTNTKAEGKSLNFMLGDELRLRTSKG